MIFSLLMCHADPYRVDASVLNLRSGPSVNAPVEAKVAKGETIEVTEINGGWAEITHSGRTLYASSKYISRLSPKASDEEEVIFGNGFDHVIEIPVLYDSMKTSSEGPLYASLFIIICLALIIMFNNELFFSSSKGFYMAAAAFLLLCFCETTHFIGYTGDRTWFCSPDKVGWGWTIANFLIFGFCMVFQVITFFTLSMAAHIHGGRDCNSGTGFILTIISVVAALVAGIFFREYMETVLIADAVLFVGWLGWCVWCNIRDNGSWLNLLLFIVMWTAGVFSTLLALTYFIMLLVIVLVAFLALYLSGKFFSGESSRSSSYPSSYYEPIESGSDSSASSGSDADPDEVEIRIDNTETIRARRELDGTLTEQDRIFARRFRERFNGEIEQID